MDHITELGQGVPEPAHFKDFWPNWARNRFARFFSAFYTTSKPKKILPKQKTSKAAVTFLVEQNVHIQVLCLGSGPGVCVDHLTIMYVYALRVFTELQNPEQNFYLVFWFLLDHRPNRTFKIYNYHWKKILTWSKNDHEYCLYACMHQCSRYGI